MPIPNFDNKAVEKAVETTKQAIASSSQNWIARPDAVANFIEVIADKISALKSSTREPKS